MNTGHPAATIGLMDHIFRKVVSAMDGNDAYEALDADTWPDFVFLDYTLAVGDSGEEVGCREEELIIIKDRRRLWADPFIRINRSAGNCAKGSRMSQFQ